MSAGWGLVATAVLLALNACFVAAEFALVSSRRANIEPRADAGSRRAATTLRAMEHVSVMLAGAQLGITLCSLALGALSEPTIARLLRGPFDAAGLPGSAVHPVAFALALLIITVLHVVLGEMVPKNVALAGPETAAVWLSPVLAAMIRVVRPVIWLLNGMANVTLRAVRVTPRSEVVSAFTRDEVADMIEESHRGGLLDDPDRDLLGGALAFDRATASDVALPFDEIHTLGRAPTPDDVEALAARTGVTRFPLRAGDTGAEGTDLIGYVHLKDTLGIPAAQRSSPVPARCVRPLPRVSAGDPLSGAIETMRTAHAHMAAVTGESGPVGIITLDDIFASLVDPRADEPN